MSGFPKGTVIGATSISTGRPFNVTIASSEPVARGSTAYIFVGNPVESDPDGGPLALKVFNNVWATSHVSRKSQEQILRRELRAARGLKHPHILTFIGYAFTDFHAVLISPLMKNGNLIQYLGENPEVDRNALILQLAQAVNYIHTAHRIVHGDLKCENILVSDDGRVLLADFGLSTFMDKTQHHTATETGVRHRFTVPFAAPELLAADGSLSELLSKTSETDVYAFGMTVLQVKRLGRDTDLKQSCKQSVHGAFTPDPDLRLRGTVFLMPGGKSAETAGSSILANVRPWNEYQLNSPYRTMVNARNLTLSIMRGPINEDSSKMRIDILTALWSSEYGQEWLDKYGIMLFTELGRRFRQCGDDAGCTLIAAELRLLDDSFVYGSIDSAKAVDKLMVPLSQVLGTTESDTYRTFPAALQGNAQEIFSVAFLSPKVVVAGSSSNSLQIWNLETGEQLGEPLTGHTDRVSCVSVSPNGMLIASGSFDRTIRLWKWDAQTHKVESEGRVIPGAPEVGRAWSVAFSPDGSNLVSGGDDEHVRMWNITTGRQINHVVHQRGAVVTSVAFSPDGRRVVSGSQDQTIRLWQWDRNSGVLQPAKNHLLTGHQRGVPSVAYSPDGSLIASGSFDHTVRVWDADSSQLKLTLRGHTYRVLSVAFSPSSKHIASASHDSTVRIWDSLRGDALGVLTAHQEPVHSVVFSPDGTRVVSGAGDGSLRVWDRISGEPATRSQRHATQAEFHTGQDKTGSHGETSRRNSLRHLPQRVAAYLGRKARPVSQG